ncbi:MAG: ImmA/IrrE family metallo-endopeptidase [Chloroflexota bacterium]|nr:ImmA/IrrE family metallo-endopeptidase [Chloroflexota bacterium]MDE2856595.1 ImmA/IrrE family metallo-endopeptidase [Chloroflexota bacterium]
MPAVNPEILIWARETAGLDVEDVAKKFFADGKKLSANEKLKLLESGEKEPTCPQLNKMSKAYHQPLLTFYLSEPPKREDRGEDFRNLPQKTSDRKGNAHLDLLMRNIKASQNLVRQLLEDEEGAEELPFIASATMSAGYQAVAKDIVEVLEFDLDVFRSKHKPREAFAYLRERIERQGIFVLLQSDLGSHHTTIPVDVFRGFAFADPIAPYIVVNRQDAVSAWSFTALHEVAHLWLGKSGVSGTWGEADVERFCDEVAASILLPTSELNELLPLQHSHLDDAAAAINEFATARNISRAMVAYNLMREDKISQSLWQALRDKFAAEWRKNYDDEKASRSDNEGGPSYYTVRRFHLGPGLIGLAKYFLSGGGLTPSKAGVVLGVKTINVYPLLNPDYYARRS